MTKRSYTVGSIYLVGHSLVVSLPAFIRERAGVNRGDRVVMWTEGDRIVLERLDWTELEAYRHAVEVEARKAAAEQGPSGETPQPVVVVENEATSDVGADDA